MTKTATRFEIVRVKDIATFADRVVSATAPGDAVPITRHRAAAFAANPYADPDDPALIIGYWGDEWVAYLGLMAGRLKSPIGLTKVLWASTIFVHPKCRGQGVGGALLKTMQALGVDTMGTEVTDAAVGLYSSLGMRELGPFTRYRATLRGGRSGGAALPLRAARRVAVALGAGAPGLDARVEASARRAAGRHHAREFRKLAKRIRREHGALDYTLSLTPDLRPAFTPDAARCERSHFHRGPEVLEWMVSHPWIAEAGHGADDVSYAFSNTRQAFGYALATLSDQRGGDAGEILFSFSRRSPEDLGDARVLDFRLAADVAPEAVVGVLFSVAADLGVAALDFPEAFRVGALRGDDVAVEAIGRRYFCMSAPPGGPLHGAAGDIVLDHCDGDTAFV